VIERHQFSGMGTTIEFVLDVDTPREARRAFGAAEAEFARLERVMSRFRADSELSRLNQTGVLEVSLDLAEVVSRAVEARTRTRGRFDPTVHDALVQAGYDRTFDELRPDAAHDRSRARCGGEIEVTGRLIRLEPGYRVDLGGIGKGFAAERGAEILAGAGPALVSAGGDIAVRGRPEDGFWPIAVEDGPTLGLTEGGLATSGSDRRRWLFAGRERHHLIDPATGEPAMSDLRRVTAVGWDAVEAEILAKVLFLGGRTEAESSGIPAVLVTAEGETVLVGGIA
jgi:thiamine biosynthesis lipoprotein